MRTLPYLPDISWNMLLCLAGNYPAGSLNRGIGGPAAQERRSRKDRDRNLKIDEL